MKKVTGLGGIFFKTGDPTGSRQWYRDNLGIDSDDYGFMFTWVESDDPGKRGYTVWCPFPDDTRYFDPSQQPFMINYRVADLPALLEKLEADGVTIVGSMVEEENGKFAWILDPDGNKIELWEPVASDQDPHLPG